MLVGVEVVEEVEEAEHCDEQNGSLCQHQETAEALSLKRWCLLDDWQRPVPGKGLKSALWRRMQSKMMEEETCC